MIEVKQEIVVDTNVAVVANGGTEQASKDCIRACVSKLRQARDEYRVLLDVGNLILDEYKNLLSFSGQPGLGDAFFKWLFENQANPKHCRKVKVIPHPHRGFEEFPPDPRLRSFHHKDRKFVAVVRASGTGPKVLNASDLGWWLHRRELREHKVEVVFLCPDLMKT